jgi:hypothetical protein
MEERFWPFPILKPEAEWNQFDRDYVSFMQSAYAAGWQPREGPCGSVEAAAAERSVTLVFRGRSNGWEPFLTEQERSVRLGWAYRLPLGQSACVCIRPPFSAAAHFALEWLRGRSLESVLQDYEFVGGSPAGIALSRPEPAPISLASSS